MLELNQDNFDENIIQSEKIVIIDFWAPWCGPCKVMAPVFEGAASEMTSVLFAKVNVDENPAIAQKYNILSIPTFIVIKNGQVVEQFSGAMGKEELKAKISKNT
ncbi:MAG: thioredoxin [Patescibacteria group bacterium]